MGCFLACFGYSNKRKKHRKSGSRILSQDQGHGSYEPLPKEVSLTLNITGDPVKDKPINNLSSKIKKKVSFNLNVKTYEPIPNDETAELFLDCNETNSWDESREESAKSVISLLSSEEKSIKSTTSSYPANYRYQKCDDSYDEEDEIGLEESDLDDDDDDGDDVSDTKEEDGWDSKHEEEDDMKICEFEFIEQFYSQPKGSNVDEVQLPAQKTKKLMPDTFSVQDMKKFEGNRNARDRSQYVHSVLNPVENLNQWKATKARSVQLLMQHKENIQRQRPLNLKTSFKQ